MVVGNRLERCADAALSVEPSESDSAGAAGRVWVVGNAFLESPGRDVWLGAEVVGPKTGRLEDVAIEYNLFSRPLSATNPTESIRIADGDRVTIRENTFDAARSFRVSYACVVASAANGSRLDHLVVEGNSARLTAGEGGSVAVVELTPEVAVGDRRVTIRGAAPRGPDGPRLVVCDGPQTNPNLRVEAVGAPPGSRTRDLAFRPARTVLRTVRSSGPATADDSVIAIGAEARTVEVILPKARSVPARRPLIFVRNDSSTGPVRLVPSGDDLFDGPSKLDEARPGSFVILRGDGRSRWVRVAPHSWTD
jgi:hypothetical protein